MPKSCRNCKARTHAHAHLPFFIIAVFAFAILGILYEVFVFAHAQVRNTAELYGRITSLEAEIEYLEGDRDYIYNELYSLSIDSTDSLAVSTTRELDDSEDADIHE